MGKKTNNKVIKTDEISAALRKVMITNNSKSRECILEDGESNEFEDLGEDQTQHDASDQDNESIQSESQGNYDDNHNHEIKFNFNPAVIPISKSYTINNLVSDAEINQWKVYQSFKVTLDDFKNAHEHLELLEFTAEGIQLSDEELDDYLSTKKVTLDCYRQLEAISKTIRQEQLKITVLEEMKMFEKPTTQNSSENKGKSGNVNITTFTTPKKLTCFTRKDILNFQTSLENIEAQNINYERMASIPQDMQDTITQVLFHMKKIEIADTTVWGTWDNNTLFPLLLEHLATTSQMAVERVEKIMRIIDNLSPLNITDWDNIQEELRLLLSEFMDGLRKERVISKHALDDHTNWEDKKQLKVYTEYFFNVLERKATPNRNRVYISAALKRVKSSKSYTDNSKLSFRQLIQMISSELLFYAAFALFNETHGFTQTGVVTNTKQGNSKRDREENNKTPGHNSLNSDKSDKQKVNLPKCEGCGGFHSSECSLTNHPNYNRSSSKWDESEMGRFFKSHNLNKLPFTQKKDGHNLVPYYSKKPPDSSSGSSSSGSSSANVQQNNKLAVGHFKRFKSKCHLCTMNTSSSTNPLISAHVIQRNEKLKVQALLDTGAEHGSYMNSRVATWLTNRGLITVDSNKLVCSCFGDCKMVNKCIFAQITFDLNNNSRSTKTINFWIIDELPYDLVIGNDDIEPTWLIIMSTENQKVSCEVKTSNSVGGSSGHPTCKLIGKVLGDRGLISPPSNNSPVYYSTGQVISPSGRQPKLPAERQSLVHISEIFNYEPDAYGIPDKWDSLDEFLNTEPLMIIQDEPVKLPTHIEGTPELQKDIKDLLVEFSDIFRTDVSSKHADVPAMDIKVDRQKWNSLKGVLGVSPRTQSTEKNEEIQRQVEKMLAAGVIQQSDANRYCQVLLVPKPDGKKRFCIDYTPLNSCCESDGWNLPNISQTLQRLGTHRPKLFAVMDFTSGYHQAPLSASSQIFSAFITWMGVYQWTRVAMGLKGAAGYFQRVMATVVLMTLIYYICELYIDDVIVHAQDAASFLSRLRQVFERFRRHNVSLNPDKCRFGLKSVEYVGHTIDETGLSFSKEKLDEVLQIEPPQHGKELRSFLGLASYFRDHIENLATIAKPLQDMLLDYDKKRKLVWTPQSEQAFLDVKEAIRRCPKLFFMDDNAPVYLHTDASDYGISGYLFQIIDGKEIPIAFMSKTLSAEEVRWSVIEKECYAIVVAFRKFEYLIRDKYFTLRTDHKNLTYVNDPPSPKVRRWKIAIQEYDFSIEHIPGKENIVADAFSRLLPISVEVLCILKGIKLPQDKYKILSSVHNTVVGHHGVERMLTKLRTLKHEWKEMREHARIFIDNCPCCQKMSNIRVSIKTHPFKLATTKPMEVIHMDTLSMGITNDNGDAYLLVLIDSCSRWLEMYPIPDLSAETAAIKVFDYFGRYGQPGKILSDNGPQFINKLHEELYLLTGIHKLETTPYSHEENGLVERANKEILRHVRSILFDKGIHKEWHTVIPLVQRILNSTKSSITGCSPAELILTNSSNLERGIYMNQIPSTVNTDSLSQWHNKRLALQRLVLASANKHLLEMEEEKLIKANGTKTEYAVNSYVLLRMPDEDIIKGNVGKLKLPLKGPMLVMKVEGDKYTLQDITTGKDYRVHVSRVSPFYYDNITVDPHVIAAKDNDEEQVEKIIDHTNVTLKSKMDFLVRWTGQNESHDLWLPWKQLRDNPKLHKYLFENGMESWIPKEHRKQEYKG